MTTVTDAPQALYRFFDADGALLYVGLTSNPGQRWGAHRGSRAWWRDVATVTLETFATRADVIAAERSAISTEAPRYNVAHNHARRPSGSLQGHRVVGMHEIAAALGVSRQRAHQLSREPGFPAPYARIKAGAIWRTADVVRWAGEKGREIHE